MLAQFLSFLRWWESEFSRLCPPGLRALFTGIPRGLTLKLDPSVVAPSRAGLEISFPLNGAWRNSKLGDLSNLASGTMKRPVDLLLPRSACLERRVEVEKKARRHALQIAELDLARSTPIDRNSIICRHRIEKGDGGKVVVQQFILKKEDVEVQRESLRAAGFMLRTITVGTGEGQALEPFFDTSIDFARPWRWWRRMNFAFFTISLTAAAYLILAPHMARLDELKHLRQVSSELRETAGILSSELEARVERHSAAVSFSDALSNHTRTVDVLAMLSKNLPDTVWIQSLELNGQTVIFNGISSTPAIDLASEALSSEYFVDPHLVGAVAIDATSKAERFKISTQIRGSE